MLPGDGKTRSGGFQGLLKSVLKSFTDAFKMVLFASILAFQVRSGRSTQNLKSSPDGYQMLPGDSKTQSGRSEVLLKLVLTSFFALEHWAYTRVATRDEKNERSSLARCIM